MPFRERFFDGFEFLAILRGLSRQHHIVGIFERLFLPTCGGAIPSKALSAGDIPVGDAAVPPPGGLYGASSCPAGEAFRWRGCRHAPLYFPIEIS